MKVVSFVGVLVLLLLMVGSASAYSPDLKIEKTASSSSYDHAGQIITYTYKVTNSGNVKISGPITVTDNKIGTFVISNKDLTTGAKVSGKATYKITKQDLTSGSVINLAYATGKYNKQQIKSNTASFTIKIDQNSTLNIQKSASPTTYSYVGQTITYTYKVTNSAKFKISGPIKITDDKIGTITLKKDLASGAVLNVKVNYKIKSKDIIAGSVTNRAYATGTYNKQKIKSNTVSFTIKTNQNSTLTIQKSASPTTYSYVGQTITYTYKVTNSAKYKITGPITIIDNKIGTIAIKKDLASGAVINAKVKYMIKSQDIIAGSVTNLAYATGTYNKQKIKSNTASFTVSSSQKLAMTLEKSASPITYSYVGQNITYTYKVTNSGNYKISGPITVTDNKTGTFTIKKDLAPGAVVTVTSTYRITENDLKAGSVTNLAIATGSVTNLVNTASSVSNSVSNLGCGCITKIVSNEAQVTITREYHNVPEFPSIVLPAAVIIGLIIISGRKK